MPIFRLNDAIRFPPPYRADPSGLLAVGGDLSPQRLLSAYRSGIFPWFSDGEPILWWSPDPRMVLFLENLVITKSLKKTLRSDKFRVTIDQSFEHVIGQCASTRRLAGQATWITREMEQAYIQLHRMGYAHSVETWHEDRLVGGLYGVCLGRCFFGESMFATMCDASKVALVALTNHLKQYQFEFVDCQVSSDHLFRMGARPISRNHFLFLLRRILMQPQPIISWSIEYTELAIV